MITERMFYFITLIVIPQSGPIVEKKLMTIVPLNCSVSLSATFHKLPRYLYSKLAMIC
ncbi:hypothetical protein [Neobacillus drentensis]|uniref:hypothetical protein n=1 Tax=Neobacillus drentensis TaxID=220684 RepID=UPI0030020FEF